MDTLRDKVGVITGAASGIGRAIARSLADKDAHIVAVDFDNDGIDALACELSDRGAAVLPQRTDVSDPEAFQGIRSAAVQRFGRVDIVMNNVGVLVISDARGEGGPMFKRLMPRARGMAYMIRRR